MANPLLSVIGAFAEFERALIGEHCEVDLALAVAQKIHPAGRRLEIFSINLSRRSLADQRFHKFDADSIGQFKAPAEKLCVEITENGAIAAMQNAIAFIEMLVARGCRFSLTDIGSSMTSFSYLKQLPVDFVKIDGFWVGKPRPLTA